MMQAQHLILDIPPNEWLTSNMRFGHWAAKAKRTRLLRQRAHMHARAKRLRKTRCKARVTAYIHGRSKRRFDPANAYPTIKAIIDGLTDAGVWDDDDSTHIQGPDMRAGDPIKDLKEGWHRIELWIEVLPGRME